MPLLLWAYGLHLNRLSKEISCILYDEALFFEFDGGTMTKKLGILVVLLATVVFWIPSEGISTAAQERRNRTYDRGERVRTQSYVIGQPRRRRVNRYRNRTTYGYRNYGQYRRTQVGNRRYRMVNRSIWRNGTRQRRLVRVYY